MAEVHGNFSRSSSSSVNTSLPDTEDDQTIARILAEEENLGDNSNSKQLGRRLSHLDSIPHTPRIVQEIPNADDATADHNRLAERLATYGLAELQIEGDGNCQFRALADQLFQNPDYHRHVRKEIVKQLKNCKQLYEGYVPMKYKSYLKKMKRTGEWGDHVSLQAAADRFGAKICLVTSFRDTCYIEILPYDKKFSRGSMHASPRKFVSKVAVFYMPLVGLKLRDGVEYGFGKIVEGQLVEYGFFQDLPFINVASCFGLRVLSDGSVM